MLKMFIPIFGSGNTVLLDSGFCVAKGITELEEKCVYLAALIKKRSYCLTGVHGDLIDTHFEGKEAIDIGVI